MGVNKVILLGRLGKDPELRYTQSQTPVANFSFATGERRKDPQSGNWTEHTEWHNVVVFGKTAENVSNYLKKGSEAFIEGRIQTRKWQDKEGKDRWTTEVVGNTVQFVGGRGDSSYSSSGPAPQPSSFAKPADSLVAANGGTVSADEVTFDDDDIPF